ncbi:DUF4012 domain-containing protein [Microbacterium sp. I2]|uniref:DUF4012 domain-containing protein n=1 Tax=Microbacterium sp. I2 TaxID=3391826 RepID=UPI003ED9B6D2
MLSSKAAPHRRRWLLFALAAVTLALVAVVGWIGVRALMVKSELDALSQLAEAAQTAVGDTDFPRVTAIVTDIERHAERASGLSSDPVWRAAEALPGVGENLRAVRVVSVELAAVAGAVPEALEVIGPLQERASGAVVDIEALAAAAGGLERLAAATEHASAELGTLDADALVSPVSSGVLRMRDIMDTLAPTSAAAAQAARLLPSVLGSDGQRTILVMVQNPAELRTAGGITGTFAEVSADGGTLSLVRQADSAEFPVEAAPVAEVPDSTISLYGDGVGRYVQNASMTTDFAVTGSLASAWWSRVGGSTPDTVIAVDPFVLQAVLAATGPVTLPTGASLSADNAIDTLLVEPYRSMAAEGQSALFRGALDAVFARTTGGDVNAFALLQALDKPAREGRISLWSAHEDENAVFAASGLGGPAARQAAAGDGAFGVYFNDATGGKMASYLRVSLATTVLACRADGLAEVAVTVGMGSDAPADAEALPMSVTGGGLFGVGAGDIGTNVTVSAPSGSYLGAVVVKGERYPAATAIDRGRAASTARVNLSPGEVNELEFRFLIPAAAAQEPAIVHTPLMNEPAIDMNARACKATASATTAAP